MGLRGNEMGREGEECACSLGFTSRERKYVCTGLKAMYEESRVREFAPGVSHVRRAGFTVFMAWRGMAWLGRHAGISRRFQAV